MVTRFASNRWIFLIVCSNFFATMVCKNSLSQRFSLCSTNSSWAWRRRWSKLLGNSCNTSSVSRINGIVQGASTSKTSFIVPWTLLNVGTNWRQSFLPIGRKPCLFLCFRILANESVDKKVGLSRKKLPRFWKKVQRFSEKVQRFLENLPRFLENVRRFWEILWEIVSSMGDLFGEVSL